MLVVCIEWVGINFISLIKSSHFINDIDRVILSDNVFILTLSGCVLSVPFPHFLCWDVVFESFTLQTLLCSVDEEGSQEGQRNHCELSKWLSNKVGFCVVVDWLHFCCCVICFVLEKRTCTGCLFISYSHGYWRRQVSAAQVLILLLFLNFTINHSETSAAKFPR